MLLPSLRLPDRYRVALGALLLVAGIAPLWPILGWAPWGADALKWIGRGAVDGDWVQWDLATRHFVGYRPVAALSYTLNHALGGITPLVYRGTDLVLHASVVGLVGGLWAAATRDRGLWFLVPMLLLLGHPVVEEVVPYVGRRSYLLAAAFAMGALIAAIEAGRGRHPARLGALCAALLGLGVLSNEVAFAVVPLVPLAIAHQDVRRLRNLWPAGAVLAVAIAARFAVLGTWGGYERRYFAFVDPDGAPTWSVLETWAPREIFAACFRYVVAPNGVTGGAPLVPEPALLPFTIGAAIWLWFVGVVGPVLRWNERAQRVPLAFAAWIIGALGIVVLSQTWFWRLGHAVLVPVALLVTWGLREGARALWDGRWAGVVSAMCGPLLITSMLWAGPLARGLERLPHAAAIDATPVLLRMAAVVRGIPGPATVWLVAPVGPGEAAGVKAWGEVFAGRRGLSFRVLATLPPGATSDEGGLALDRDPVHPQLTLSGGYSFLRYLGIPDAPLDLSRLGRRRDTTGWLVALDARSAWAVALPARSGPEVSPAPEPPEPVEAP